MWLTLSFKNHLDTYFIQLKGVLDCQITYIFIYRKHTGMPHLKKKSGECLKAFRTRKHVTRRVHNREDLC